MWSTRRVTIEHKTPKKKWKRSKQREFIIIIYSSWSFSSYSFQVQVSGKQNWLTEWQNKHRTVETETYLSYSPLVLHQPKHTLDNLIIPLGNTHSKLIYLNHRYHPSSSLIFLVFILTHVSQDWGGRQWFYQYPLKESHTSCHATLSTPCAVFGNG